MDQLLEQPDNLQAQNIAKQAWHPTPDSLQRLLHWLDGGTDSRGERYEIMRQRLMNYFDRKNCLNADDLTDETMQRVMKWLEENDKSFDEEPAKVCFNTARFVFLESLRKAERDAIRLTELPVAREPNINPAHLSSRQDEQAEQERQLNCLEKCTQKLIADERELIVRYYYGEQRVKLENRKALASACNLSANALAIKACRIRDRLRLCVQKCLCE
jgi:DNA-directed RNA polymerase specialized sigma24 family protein